MLPSQPPKSNNDAYDAKETKRRAESAIQRMLSTPHKPHVPVKKKPSRKAKATRKPRKSTDSRA